MGDGITVQKYVVENINMLRFGLISVLLLGLCHGYCHWLHALSELCECLNQSVGKMVLNTVHIKTLLIYGPKLILTSFCC